MVNKVLSWPPWIDALEQNTLAGLPTRLFSAHRSAVVSIKYFIGAAMLPNRVALPSARPLQLRRSSLLQKQHLVGDRCCRAFHNATDRWHGANSCVNASDFVDAPCDVQGKVLRPAAARIVQNQNIRIAHNSASTFSGGRPMTAAPSFIATGRSIKWVGDHRIN